MKKSYFIGADVSQEQIDFYLLSLNENTKPKFVPLLN